MIKTLIMEMDAAQLERYEKLVTTVILYLNILLHTL